VAAGAVVQPGVVVPAGELWAGNPARKLRAVKPNETEYFSTVRVRHTLLPGQLAPCTFPAIPLHV
jgi:gamma-carbonic anhydrase